MAENKTKASEADVAAFIGAVEPASKRADAQTLARLMQRLSSEPPVLWGPSIIGFGRYHYRYDSGREGDAPRVGFSPRKAALVLYLADGFPEHAALLARLGKHTTGVSCLYIKKLADVDLDVLEALVAASLVHMAARYPA